MNDVTYLGEVMSNIAELLCDCLEGTPLGRPGFCGTYHNAPPDDASCDNCPENGELIVWWERLYPYSVFPQPFNGAVGMNELRMAAALAVRLIRPCWPMPQSGPGGGTFPSRTETETFALNLAIDASTIECCLLADMQSDDASVITGSNCASIITAPVMEVDRNRAGCAGATARFVVSLGSCCIPTPGS